MGLEYIGSAEIEVEFDEVGLLAFAEVVDENLLGNELLGQLFSSLQFGHVKLHPLYLWGAQHLQDMPQVAIGSALRQIQVDSFEFVHLGCVDELFDVVDGTV